MPNLAPNAMHDLASGGSVTIRLSTSIRKAQLVAEGFSLQDATVEVTPIGTSERQSVTIDTTAIKTGTIGNDDFQMQSITISGVTGSDLKVGAYQ